MNYTPHTEEDVKRSLDEIGAGEVEELFSQIPRELLDPAIEIPSGLDEVSLLERLKELAAKNSPASSLMGGGLSKRFIPSVVPHLAMQSEFVTAYTPYQPEVSQGILQATFEFQTMMSELTGLPVSNASMYDGASTVAEAALMAVRHTGRESVLVSRGVHPQSREVLSTYLKPLEIDVRTVDLNEELTTSTSVDVGGVAAVIVQQPNYLGYLEDMEALGRVAHGSGALFVAVVDPLSLGVLAPPGEYGADVAVGDGQTIGNPLNFGGPHFGFMVVTQELLRQLPGRIVGETTDVDGRRAFVLTLQAREQHIRRARAKSNICSNHQLTALMSAVHLAALGPQGLRDCAVSAVAQSHRLADELADAGYRVRDRSAFFNEFVVELDSPATEVIRDLSRAGIQAGIAVPAEYGLGPALLLGATELTRPRERELLLQGLERLAPASARAGARG